MFKGFVRTTVAIATGLAGTIVPLWAHAAEASEHLWYADREVSAYYVLDAAAHQLVLLTEPAPGAPGTPTRVVKPLRDGERIDVALSGQGAQALTTALTVRRDGPQLHVAVRTTLPQR